MLIDTITRFKSARYSEHAYSHRATDHFDFVAHHLTFRKSSESSIPQNLIFFTNLRRGRQGTNFLRTRISSSCSSVCFTAREVTTARFLRNPSIAIAGLRDRARVPRWNLTGMSTFTGFDFTVERESTCVVATGPTHRAAALATLSAQSHRHPS